MLSYPIHKASFAAILALAGGWALCQDPAQEAQRAQRAMVSGDYRQAVDIYSRLSAAFPQNLDIRKNLGLALHSTGRYSDALRCFDFVLRRNPRDKAALLFSGIELSSLHEADKAISNLSQFLQEDDQTAAAFLARGRAYLSTNHFQLAAKDFTKAADIEPGNVKAWEGLGESYLLAAQAAFQTVEERDVYSAEWYGLLARSYLSAEDYKTAFRFFHEAESRAPDLPGIHAGLAEVYQQINHPDWATIEFAREKQAIHFAFTDLRKRYIDALDFQQRGAEALARLARSPETPEYHALLGLAYRMQRRDFDSIDEFRRSLALAPERSSLKLELATSLAVAKKCDAAVPLLQEILKEDPNSTEANHVLGECFVEQDHLREAIPHLQIALKQDSHLLPAEFALGRAYFHSGNYREAVAYLRKAAVLGDPSLFYQLSQAYAKMGDQKASADYLAQYKARTAQIREANRVPTGEITPP